MVAEAKRVLGLTSRMQHICDQFPSQVQQQLQDQLSLQPPTDQDRAAFQTSMANTNGFSPLQVQLPEDLYPDFYYSSSRRNSPTRDSSSPTKIGPALARNPCRYFARGYCPYGSKCWFWHGLVSQSSRSSSSATPQREMRGEVGINASGSLERLEMELHDLLRARNAPASLSYLPQLYHRTFGKYLQADGYLAAIHGQVGSSLTKLLTRLKNTLTLIDGPDGKGAVVLEEAPMFTAYRSEREELSGENLSCRKIYHTFAAESLLTEEDVKSYFRCIVLLRSVFYTCLLAHLPPTMLYNFASAAQSSSTDAFPCTHKEATSGQDSQKWREAEQRELGQLSKHNVARLCILPDEELALPSKWVYKIKRTGLYKARFVVRGDKQRRGVDYVDTFAAVVCPENLRLILALF